MRKDDLAGEKAVALDAIVATRSRPDDSKLVRRMLFFIFIIKYVSLDPQRRLLAAC
jgi:hypothetical protein